MTQMSSDEAEKISLAFDFLRAAGGKPIAVDTETNAEDIRDGRGFAMGVSIAYRRADGSYDSKYFPFRHRGVGNLPSEVLDALRTVVESAPSLVFHNAKFDIVSLSTLGITVPSGRWYDTMIMAHLINENFPFSKSLDSCAKAYLGEEWQKDKTEIEDIIKHMGWSWIPAELMEKYASLDAEITYRLMVHLMPLFRQEGLEDYWHWKARLIEVVITMESRGVGIDTEFCNRMIDSADQYMQDYLDMLEGYSPGSAKQMKELLIDKMGLPVVKRTKTGGPSFDKEAMNVYEEILERIDSPFAEYILGYRGWQKARSAFFAAYLEHLSPDGRLRPSYRHHKDSEEGGTVTGRLSCANPNLQQIPRKSDKPWNGNVKAAFRATEGYSLYEADYSQLELRLGTAYANEPSLKQIFLEGRDIFTEMSGWLGWPRQNVKTFVYSTQYGAGKKRISDVFGVSLDKAGELIEDYYRMFPGFREQTERASARVFSQRRVPLWSGRFRHFTKPRDEAHKSFNSVIQGGAADVVERVMVRLFDDVDQKSNGEVRMLLQVHDSVIFEIKNGTQQKWEPKIVQTMEAVNEICVDFGVKFAVDFHRFGE